MVVIWTASVHMEGGNGQKIVLLLHLGYWYYVAFVQLVLYPFIALVHLRQVFVYIKD